MKKSICLSALALGVTCLLSSPIPFFVNVAQAQQECAPEEPDQDDDGLCDRLDGCPTDRFRISPGICGCGTDPSGEDDSDGDLLVNCQDSCPNNSSKTTSPGICGCEYQSPEPDFDNDQYPDCPEQTNNPLADQCTSDPDKHVPGVCGCGNEENIALCDDHCEEEVSSSNVLSKVTRSTRNVRVQFKLRPGFDTSCLAPEDPETDEDYQVVAKIKSKRRGPLTIGPIPLRGSSTALSVSFNTIRMSKKDTMEFIVKKIEPENGGEDEEFTEVNCRATSSRKVSCTTEN